MSRQVRRLSLVFALLMVAVLVNITLIQVVNAGDYRDRPGNQRILLAEYDRERGPILVGTDPVARSVETGNTLTYLRQYSNPRLYAPITGFYSLIYGATGLERTENRILNGRSDIFAVDRIQQLVSGRQPVGGAVTTTIDAAAQRAAYLGLRGKKGAVVAIEPATGRILASVQAPSFDPNKLSSHDPTEIRDYYNKLESDADKPLLNRPIVSLNPPGSTFKLVTAAAALSSGRFNPNSVIPGRAPTISRNPTRSCVTGTGASADPVARSPSATRSRSRATPRSRGWVTSSVLTPFGSSPNSSVSIRPSRFRYAPRRRASPPTRTNRKPQ